MWQADITAWQLADGQRAEILNLIDDHSRLFLGSDAYQRVKAADVVASFHKAAQLHGLPYSLLSDNGAVFTGSSRKGKVLLESELERLGIALQELTPLPPPDLREGRAATPDTQALPGKATPASDPHRAPDPARHLRPLLQRHPPPQSPRAAAHRYRPTAPASRPGPPAPQPQPTSGSARTRSTRPARSASATTASSTKSASAEPTKAARSSSSSPTSRSASSTQTASSSASSRSTPAATYQPLTQPEPVYDLPRHLSPMS